MKLSNFKVLTFDCYGTLIDWEKGLLTALTPLVEQVDGALTADELLELFARFEAEEEHSGPGKLYQDILVGVYQRLASHYGVPADQSDAVRFGASVPSWPAFPDSTEALRYLKAHFKLVILSNIDHSGFAGSQHILGVEFDHVFTAEDIGSYKPDPGNFHYMLERLSAEGFAKQDILHTAQSIFHDHIPAKRLGFSTAWIDRRKGKPGWGATAVPEEMPTADFHFGSLGEMAAAHRKES